jgi:hypothetical protein
MLDAIGIACASTQFESAGKALAGLQFFGGGDHPRIDTRTEKSIKINNLCCFLRCERSAAHKKKRRDEPGAEDATY